YKGAQGSAWSPSARALARDREGTGLMAEESDRSVESSGTDGRRPRQHTFTVVERPRDASRPSLIQSAASRNRSRLREAGPEPLPGGDDPASPGTDPAGPRLR